MSLKLSLLGTVIGFLLTVAISRSMISLTYAIRPSDPAIFLAVDIFVAASSMLAAYFQPAELQEFSPWQPFEKIKNDGVAQFKPLTSANVLFALSRARPLCYTRSGCHNTRPLTKFSSVPLATRRSERSCG
jgi:hypothetical protein